ncbi:MAG TPA: hypothetical protein VFQ20_09355 [Burkholderiaceae bacterium]|nr:hypothetical protein [Burkholderiaceae bacterium]
MAPPIPPLRAAGAADASCLAWFADLDAAVDRAGVRDAEADRVDGFAALRVNRLAAALAPRAARSDAAFAAWLDTLRRLDLEGRRVELANLPVSERPPADRLDACSAQLAATVAGDAAARAALLQSARVPDRYRRVSRVAGLYALTRIPFFAGVQAWQREHEAAMRAAARDPQPARRFVPEAAPADRDALRFERDALGLPVIDSAAAERLLRAHAPVFDIEHRGPFDDFGAPAWNAEGRIDIDRRRPTVYQRIAATLVHGQALVQLVYTLWFPERPRTHALDLLGGKLDGVIVRLTLAPDGTPILLDTIHACGCWHLFFPGPGVTPRPDAPAHEEWAFAPARLPALARGERVVVRIASATHDVLGVTRTADTGAHAAVYAHAHESALRTLPRADGGTRSLYGANGLVQGSERVERFFFWPMGIASAGAMRQWGHHATAFVGRRHFDDADLIERRFDVDPANAR